LNPKGANQSHNLIMPPKKAGVLYAKNAKIDDIVHAKASDTMAEAACRRYYGKLWKKKWVSGMIHGIECKDVNGRQCVYYDVEFELPGEVTRCVQIKALSCRPGRWVDPNPGPELELWSEPWDKCIPIDWSKHPINPETGSCGTNDEENIDPASRNLLDESTVSMSSESSNATSTPDDVPEEIDTPQPEPPIVNVHGLDWFKDISELRNDMNGPVRKIPWQFRGRDGNWWESEDDLLGSRTMLDYFLSVFPPNAMKRIILLTNVKLRDNNMQEIDIGDLLKFFGIMILITRFKFGNRRDLWRVNEDCRYIPAPRIGDTTGMSKNRFDEIWQCLTFSEQPDERPANMSSEAYRWMLVDDFVMDFNRHRQDNFRPSEVVSAYILLPNLTITSTDMCGRVYESVVWNWGIMDQRRAPPLHRDRSEA
jgi:hypothetical protein